MRQVQRCNERYMPLSKRFNRYRKDLGVHEQDEGKRQSRVDFHSFRRWLITKADQADIPPHIIEIEGGNEHHVHAMGCAEEHLFCEWFAKGTGSNHDNGFVKGYCRVDLLR
jgi:hypothetical protein